MAGLLEELSWRGMLQDTTPGLEEYLNGNEVVGYLGVDPTAPSMHIGNLASLMFLVHLQRHGGKAIAVIGGATGMVGDPSGKSDERNLLDEVTLRENESAIKQQLNKLCHVAGLEPFQIVNNYDWYKHFNLLAFLRDVGKNLSINYMMAKDSVQKRLETGISFTEFSYQLLQGFDFYYLCQNHNCKLQMGGSDQWGNMTAGIELTRRLIGQEVHALTGPLVTKADGSKFGKSEEGNVWLDPYLTSPYHYYQFWLQASDEDAPKLIRRFTLLEKNEIEALEEAHQEAPHERALQKKLAAEASKFIHGQEALENAKNASEILFGKVNEENLMSFSAQVYHQLASAVPHIKLKRDHFQSSKTLLDLLTDSTQGKIFSSKGEMRKLIKNNGLMINKLKVSDPDMETTALSLIHSQFLLVQKGKKNYFLIEVR